ncbi:hypothetical protein OSB04_un000401, partial [Centaurea solstitialis]
MQKQVLIGNFFKRKFQEDDVNDVGSNNANDNVGSKPNSSGSIPSGSIPSGSTRTGSIASGSNPSGSTPSLPNGFDLNDLPSDPFDRPPIASYHPNQRDDIRRHYLVKKAFQPRSHKFPYKEYSSGKRRFSVQRFDSFPWLEYSVKADKAYCLYCYLFKEDVGNQGGKNVFSSEDFGNWSKSGVFKEHVGLLNSHHNKAMQKCDDLLKQKQAINVKLNTITDKEKLANRYRLLGSVISARHCLENKLPFRAHDESETSRSKGCFLSILKLVSEMNPDIGKHTLGNAKKNNKLTSPLIQKDIIDCFVKEVSKRICEEIKNNVFGLLVDESSDVSSKEQMAIVLRYVDKPGVVRESFIGIAHVTDTSSSTLKEAIVSMLANHQLSIDQVRGQGYDGASNMRGEFNGLRAMILRDNPSAHYIHCFAHQLQLVIVAVAKKHEGVKDFFEYLNMVVTTVSASCKRKDMIREAKRKRVADGIRSGEIKTGKGLNQKSSLLRSGDTRWGSHHATIISVLKLFPEVVDVLCYVKEEGDSIQQRSSAKASSLINGTKQALNDLRQNGFEDLLKKVTSFCETNHIEKLDMMGSYGNPRKRRNVVTNRHHFEIEIFNTVLDMQIQELGNRFNEVSTTLVGNMSGLNPCNGFSKFDISKIVAFSEMYPIDFTMNERACILGELK